MTRLVAAPPRTDWLVQDGRGHRAAPPASTRDFHRRLPGYAPSPLVRADGLAEELGLGEVWIKDESDRLGLPSFKILGASWATYVALRDRGGFADGDWTNIDELASLVAERTGVTRLAAATDGNHGRAVAHVAAWLGLGATIFVPQGTSAARIEAIVGEGATVEVVDGGYEDAVNRSAQEAADDCLVISDTSWEGYETVPATVVEGYSTIFEEAEAQLSETGAAPLDVVVVQVGVGALAGAAARQYRGAQAAVRLVCVEPVSAACNLVSMQHGERVSIPGPHASIMVGLNCDTPSLVAWPDVSQGFDVFIAVEDGAAREAMRALSRMDIVSGETGAAGLAGLTELCRGPAREAADHIGLGPQSRVLLISTEGATDPAAYAAVVGAQEASVRR
jgi:diaminopropionate ammonia-lyase